MKLRTFDEVLATDFKDDLNDPEFSAEYLRAALEESQTHDDMGIFLVAVGDVLKARGSMAGVAAQMGKSRPSFYKSLSRGGNPEFATIARTLPALGFKLQILEADGAAGTSVTEHGMEPSAEREQRQREGVPKKECEFVAA